MVYISEMTEKDHLGTRLNQLMKAKGLRNVDVASACDVSAQAVLNWRRTGRIDKKHFQTLSKLFEVPLGYWLPGAPEGKLVTLAAAAVGELDPGQPASDDQSNLHDVDIYSGTGSRPPTSVKSRFWLPFQPGWLNRWQASEADIEIVQVAGSSMEPTLYERDIAFVHRRLTKIQSDKVYSIAIAQEALIRRLFFTMDGGLRIVSDNPDKTRFRDELIPPADLDKVHVFGRVIQRLGSGGLE